MMLSRTLIVQGDRDPLYPVESSVEMSKSDSAGELVDRAEQRTRACDWGKMGGVCENGGGISAGVSG